MTTDTDVDWQVVDALCRGVAPAKTPTHAERYAAFKHLVAAGMSDAQVGHLIGRSQRTVLRWRTEAGLPGLGFGANGFTRPRDWPLPARNYKK